MQYIVLEGIISMQKHIKNHHHTETKQNNINQKNPCRVITQEDGADKCH